MSWETTATATLHFNRQTYNSLYEAEDRLDEVRKYKRDCEQKIRILMAGDPSKLLNIKDCEGYDLDTLDVVYNRANELLEWYNECIIEEFKLELLIENFETREGDFVKPPQPPKDPAQTEIHFEQPPV